MSIFIPPDECTSVPQLLFLTAVYGVILYQSSQMIAGGSELLLLFPSVAGIVGSVVLPILGAVPDGMMVLFSGLGPDAQNQVSVGVGALAGSTVMLLTFPWFIAVFFGRVAIVDGEPKYSRSEGGEAPGPLSGGVTYQDSLIKSAYVMLATTLLFLVIQLPASVEETETSGQNATSATSTQASAENIWSLVGMIAAIGSFAGYLVYCFIDANEDKALARVIVGIQKKQISIGAALRFAKDSAPTEGPEEALKKKCDARLAKIVWPFFALYDADQDRTLDVNEFHNLLRELGERPQEGVIEALNMRDANKDGKLDFNEVVVFLQEYLEERNLKKLPSHANKNYLPSLEEEEEAEEVPEDLADLSPEQQLRRLLLRSCWMMGLGTLLVLIFSDPMVDVLSTWGVWLNISPFYISFVLAPFASNASELLSAYTYACKKSSKSITTALSTLVGAACMNNTFCLAIFLALVYFKDLAWQFTSETLAIMLIQWVIGFLTVKGKSQRTVTAYIILMCYPGCLFIVWFFENVVGWD